VNCKLTKKMVMEQELKDFFAFLFKNNFIKNMYFTPEELVKAYMSGKNGPDFQFDPVADGE
jgi:hypothetical protein